MFKKRVMFFLFIFCLLCSNLCSNTNLLARELRVDCRVSKVLDGDTFHCSPTRPIPGTKLHKDGTVSVRLRGVDAVEKKQSYGVEAKKSLEALIKDKTVVLEVKDIDRYGRVAAYVYTNGLNINLEQIKRGYAWAYTEYLDRPYASEFYGAERHARERKLGLWSDRNPTPPWEWRKLNR